MGPLPVVIFDPKARQKHELDQPNLRNDFENAMEKAGGYTSPGPYSNGGLQEIQQGGANEDSGQQLERNGREAKSIA